MHVDDGARAQGKGEKRGISDWRITRGEVEAGRKWYMVRQHNLVLDQKKKKRKLHQGTVKHELHLKSEHSGSLGLNRQPHSWGTEWSCTQVPSQ